MMEPLPNPKVHPPRAARCGVCRLYPTDGTTDEVVDDAWDDDGDGVGVDAMRDDDDEGDEDEGDEDEDDAGRWYRTTVDDVER